MALKFRGLLAGRRTGEDGEHRRGNSAQRGTERLEGSTKARTMQVRGVSGGKSGSAARQGWAVKENMLRGLQFISVKSLGQAGSQIFTKRLLRAGQCASCLGYSDKLKATRSWPCPPGGGGCVGDKPTQKILPSVQQWRWAQRAVGTQVRLPRRL